MQAYTYYIHNIAKIVRQFITSLAVATPTKKSQFYTGSQSALFSNGNGYKKKSRKIPPKLSYIPVCWQCGTEKGLLKLHTGSGLLYVCRTCGGEQ